MAVKKKAKKRSKKKLASLFIQGWRTSDQDEYERRRQRGANEHNRIVAVAGGNPFYGNYRVHSGSGSSYAVEIRSLVEPLNSCGCPDHAVNRLGTCKHVEAVLHKLAKSRKRRFQEAIEEGSPVVEIYLDRRDEVIKIIWPRRSRPHSKLRKLLEPYFSADDTLLRDASIAFPVLRRNINNSSKALRDKIKISHQIEPWLEYRMRQTSRDKARQTFKKDVANGKRTLDVVNATLYPYQQHGMLHLAFTERALLADEMGLGKTVQAIAGCVVYSGYW